MYYKVQERLDINNGSKWNYLFGFGMGHRVVI